VYLEGDLTEIKSEKRLNVGDSLLVDAKVRLWGKLAVFLDTLGGILRTFNLANSSNNEVFVKDLPGIQGEAPKCCASSFTHLKFNLAKPFPVFQYPIYLSLTQSEQEIYLNKNDFLVYKIEIEGQKILKRLPIDKSTKKIEFFRVIQNLQKITQDSLFKELYVLKYLKEERRTDDFGDLRRDILLINPLKLKTRLTPSIQFFKERFKVLNKDYRELIISCLSLLIYELYGYPDEENLLIWLNDNFQYDLR
jgi:hypothetical protein